MSRPLKRGAILISDAHYAPYRGEFCLFLEKILKEVPPQLFLLGDMFDFLAGGVGRSIEQNREAIGLIQKISLKTELFYFEGNHDYNLNNLFKSATIFKRGAQPASFEFDGKKVLISHGDIYASALHEFYFWIVSNQPLLRFLDFIDTKLLQNRISDNIYRGLAKKSICRDIENFMQIAKIRASKYDSCDIVIEGHHHQDVEFRFDGKRYINLSAFACNRSYFCVESLNNGFVLSRASL